MEIKQSEFIISAVAAHQYPVDQRLEIAFVGRSNVGKSSLINSLTNRKKLVKVSGTPGKTRLINFFLINTEFYFVDLPGYGYAKISKQEKATWGKIIETYLFNREPLKNIFLLLDCRHKPTNDDMTMFNWFKYYGYPITIIATKSDKLTKNELQKSQNIIRETLNLSKTDKIFYYSSLKKSGREELLEHISEIITVNNGGDEPES